MRTLAIGDIHGCSASFQYLIDHIDLQTEDTLILLGDYVDRGPDTCGVIEKILDLQATYNVITLRGNHEVLLMTALDDSKTMQRWCRPEYGGSNTIMSYGITDPREMPEQHLTFIRNTQRYYETAEHIFVHANLNPVVPLLDQQDDYLLWERFENTAPHVSGKTMICGHSAQSSGIPKTVGYAACIDTCVFAGGWLTCLEPSSGDYWQANEMGDIRTGNLSQL